MLVPKSLEGHLYDFRLIISYVDHRQRYDDVFKCPRCDIDHI